MGPAELLAVLDRYPFLRDGLADHPDEVLRLRRMENEPTWSRCFRIPRPSGRRRWRAAREGPRDHYHPRRISRRATRPQAAGTRKASTDASGAGPRDPVMGDRGLALRIDVDDDQDEAA